MNSANSPSPKINVCLFGQGIVCGLTVHVNDTCDIEIGGGTAVTQTGTLVKVATQKFDYYLKQPTEAVKRYFPESLGEKSKEDRTIIELTLGKYDANTMDSLSKQYPTDLPTRQLLEGKILVILVNEDKPTEQHFLLVTPSVLVGKRGGAFKQAVQEVSKSAAKDARLGIFSRQKPKVEYKPENIEKVLFPYLQLPDVVVTRFGYKKLAIIDKGKPFGIENLQNPLSKITKFEHIFNEYKAILDDLIPEFIAALEKLHTLYGDSLTHKGKDYWAQYRHILDEKWCAFLEGGEHLYYIQYFYDWLTDMVKAYDELREHLSAFVGACMCDDNQAIDANHHYTLIHLGPVLGGRTSYTPTLFRDYFQPPLIDGDNENHWREIKFLHWRLMMMIWTFDLPQLRLDEKVLVKGRYIMPAKEFEDSTNYLEKTNKVDLVGETVGTVNLEDLPIKFTPSQTPDTLIGEQAIPYYYPLDADSPYSLHRFWNYRLAQMKLIHKIRSYNAFKDPDSFASDKNALFPLAFNLRNYPFLKVEGHIGKKISFKEIKAIQGIPARIIENLEVWHNLIWQYNLTMLVVAIPLSKLAKNALDSKAYSETAIGIGLEHIGGLEQGQTLVLVYEDNINGEQIELNECKKDKKPEIEPFTIVADFTVPAFIFGK